MSRVRSLRSFDGARVPKPMLKLNTAFRSQRERSTSIDLSSLAQHVQPFERSRFIMMTTFCFAQSMR